MGGGGGGGVRTEIRLKRSASPYLPVLPWFINIHGVFCLHLDIYSTLTYKSRIIAENGRVLNTVKPSLNCQTLLSTTCITGFHYRRLKHERNRKIVVLQTTTVTFDMILAGSYPDFGQAPLCLNSIIRPR